MSRRKFDRYMVVTGAGNHVKFARLSEAERCAHFLGVLSIAAQSPIRGCLLVGDQEAEAVEIAYEARVSEKVAKATLVKLKAVGVLERDDDLGCWRVHDWDDVNPAPKDDATAAERAKRYRDKRKACHATVTPTVTAPSRRDDRDGHAPVTGVSREEVEVEVEEKQSPTDSPDLAHVVNDLFVYWQQQTGHTKAKPSRDRLTKVRARLNEGYTPEQIRAGIDGAAAQPFINDQGDVFDDLELICRTGSKLENFIARATYTPQRPAGQSRRSEHEQLQDERKAAGLRLLDQFTDESTEAA